jgi:hypothetical protein
MGAAARLVRHRAGLGQLGQAPALMRISPLGKTGVYDCMAHACAMLRDLVHDDASIAPLCFVEIRDGR